MYGQAGILAYDDVEDKVQCHICGKWFRGLNNHVWKTHDLSADDYREEFGLNRGQGLICEGTRQRLSESNKKLGNWKHLNSQTMSKDELSRFLRSIAPERPIKLRQQACLLKAELLTAYNPMNEPEAQKRALTKLRKTYYGSERMKDICRQNIHKCHATIRERNLSERRYTCPCGEAFTNREEGEHHRKKCPVARESSDEKRRKTRLKRVKDNTVFAYRGGEHEYQVHRLLRFTPGGTDS